MAAYDDLNVKRIFSVGILSVVVTAVTALAVQVVYYWLVEIQSAETAAASDYTRQNQILQQQQDEISKYDVNVDTGKIVIPVAKAFEVMVGKASDTPAEQAQANEDHAEEQKDAEQSEET